MQILGPIDEGNTAKWDADLTEEDGTTAIANSSINAATCTLINLEDGLNTTINERGTGEAKYSIINAGTGQNGFTFDADGNMTWTISAADNEILNSDLSMERHLAIIEITYSTTKFLKFELEIRVANLHTVT